MPPLNILSDILLAIAFLTVPVAFLAAISRQERLNVRIRTASTLCGVGMVTAALGFVFPHALTDFNGTFYEFALKLIAAASMIAASLIGWPLIRLASRHTKLLASLPETQLLLLERDDLATAKTALEKEVVKHSYQLERANRQMRLALLGSPITVFRQDKDLRYTWIFNVPEGMHQSDYIGRTDAEVHAPETALTLSEIKRAAMDSQEEQSAEARVRLPSGTFWYMLRSQPDYDQDGHVIGTISCAVNITEQKRREQRQTLLMREVTHRSKNLLAVLQSIVRQTARRTDNMDDFLARLNSRIQSIAKSHDLLVNDDWSGTSLKKLFESQLNVLADVEPERVQAEGPDILLTSVAVQNLGLAFHELSTNATKFGALSEPDGMVQVSWDVEHGNGRSNGAGNEDFLRLVWHEIDGPAVVRSEDAGFGRLLLERVVGQALGGEVKLDFAETGLVCTMVLPASRTMADRED